AVAALYGAAAWYCNGTLTPRGTQFSSDWVTNVDLSFRYNVPSVSFPGNLVLRADVFNVFDFRNVTSMNEFGETDGGAPNPNYRQPTGYQTPRYIRLGFDLTF